MSSKTSFAEGSPLGPEKRRQTHQGSGSLWSSQDEMKRYVSKLKSELDEQKNRVKRVHRDKAEEIKRLQENLDNEKQKAIENVAKRLESDKAYELKKLRETVVKQKESELRQVLRLKDEEMRTLKLELQENKNKTRILEMENKRILNERSKGDSNDLERRMRNEVTALRHDKRRLEESLRIKSEADFQKAEIIRKMKYEHENEVQRLTRESKRESLKEFRHLKAVSKEIEAKNHQLAAKELEMRRLEEERNALGNELNLQRRKSLPDSNLRKSKSFNLQKQKGLSVSHISESDFERAAEDKIKKLKVRNSELVAIARKLEEKAKQLQEEKDILEKSRELTPEIGNLKKAFARQRAKDLAEHAKLLMNKEHEINNLKKEALQGSFNGFVDNKNVNELEKIVQQSAKERLLLEKQLSSKQEVWMEEVQEMSSKGQRLSHDNEILKDELHKLQDVEVQHFKAVFEMNEIREELKKLKHVTAEKDKRMYKLELEKQTCVAKNNALQKKNDELSQKIDQLGKLEDECRTLKNNLETLEHDNDVLKEENSKLRKQIESLCALKKEVDRLQQENLGLQNEKEDSLFKLEEREDEISRLHKAQDEAQKKHNEQVSELDKMVRRLKEQCGQTSGNKDVEFHDRSLDFHVLNSTPKSTKFTQTSRPSSPTLSPITDHLSKNFQEVADDDIPSTTEPANHVQDSLLIPDYGTSSSTSFDLEKAATRIEQLAASDSDETDFRNNEQKKDLPVTYRSASEISDVSEDDDSGSSANEDTSYSADVSRASDFEEPCEIDENSKKEVKNGDDEGDANVFIGNQLESVSDVEEKLSIFIAKYSYDPMLYSPNDNPETELAFQAGDYLYVYGDIDEDGFFVGELMSGERGLVPSNFVERIAEEDEAILRESVGRDDEDETEERRHEIFRTSLDHVLNDRLGDIRESEEEDLANSFHSENDPGIKKLHNKKTEVDQNFSDSLDSMDSNPSPPRVPSPSKLRLDRQFTKSALISWRGASLPSDEIQGYNVYVDGKLKTQIKGSNKTNVLVEGIDPSETYRLSVRTKSVDGQESPDHEATMVFGPDARLSPYDLQMLQITRTSAEIQWLPANSSYAHEVFLDNSLLQCVNPAISSYTLNELSPSTLYRARIRTQIPSHLRLAIGKASTEDNLSSEIEFTTLAGGLPEPPVNLRLEQQTLEKIILTWLPVTITPAGYSNGFKVSGYKVYVNGIYCTETDSSSVDSVSIPTERLCNLGKRHDFTRIRFVVRTLSVLGESADSNVVEIPSGETSYTNTSRPALEGLDSEENKTKTGTETAAADICETNPNATAQDESSARHTSNKVFSDLESDTTISDQLSAGSDLEKKHNQCRSVEGPRWSAAATDTEESTENELEIGQEDFIKKTCEQVYRTEPAGEYNSEKQHGEPGSAGEVGLRPATENTDKNRKVTEPEIGQGHISETRDVLPIDSRRKPVVVLYDIEDDETETESCTAESKTETEEEPVEIFVDPKMTKNESEGGNDVEQLKNLAQNTVIKNETEVPNIHIAAVDEQQSESETDTEYGPLLSVIDEVDEENLTDTNNNSFTEKTDGNSNNKESAVSDDQWKLSLSNPSGTSSVCSESKSGTLSSEDGGFRTDDDVLDLLDDDDEGDFVRKPEDKLREGEGSTGTREVTDNTLARPTACKDADSELINGSSSQSQENETADPHKSESKEVQSGVENQETMSDSTLSEKEEANENTTAEESNGDVSESSYPTRTSLNSSSSLSISDAPPPPDKAMDIIIKTLSLPGCRKPESGESDLNDNPGLGTRSEGTPGMRSESCRSQSEVGENITELIRYFVALYNYDPFSMSPNADGADEELPFTEGDLIKVFGDKDDDGFFWGECKRKQGFVPSNMVSEITIDEAEDLFNEATNSIQSFEGANKLRDERINGDSELDVDVVSKDYIRRISSEGIDLKDKLAFWETMGNGDLGPRKMRALFDYDPVKDSPNVDSEVELKFKTGEIIYIFGNMDDDGFFQGELRGIRGLVPSNFLEPAKDSDHENEDNVETGKLDVSWAKGSSTSLERQSTELSPNLPNGTSNEQEDQQKKRKGILSKGKKIFKKAFR